MRSDPAPNPRFLRALPAVVLLATVLLAAPAALAQAPEEPTEPGPGPDVFGEVIDVRVVNVEVVVTDRDGNRVTGLEPGDFRLTVDGEPVPVEYFSEVVGGAVRPTADAAVAAAPGAAEGTVGTSYLVFVDDFFAIARDRDQVLQALADDLDFVKPGDRMAVVAFDGTRVEMLTTWSDSPRELRRALSDAQARPARGLTRLAERRNHDLPLRGSLTARSADSIRDLGPEDRFYAHQVAGQVETAVSGAVAALRGFAQPPGRKVMLLVAGGWPFSPAAYAANVRTVMLDSSVPEGPELMRPLVDTANLLGYTIYPIDAPGLGGGSGADASSGAEGGLGSGSFDREITTEDTLHHLAAATGGEALINARRRAPLEHVEADTRSYYWLGFSPRRQGDDRRHDIEVEVTRPGLRVRSRDGYRDLSRQAERQMAVESALLFGDPATEGLLPVEVGEARPAGRRQVDVPLAIAIPVDFVTLLPVGDPERWVVRLELRVGVLDENQRQATPPAVPVELTFRQRPEAGKHVPYNTTLKLRRAEQVLVVVVTDVASGRSLTARVTVDP